MYIIAGLFNIIQTQHRDSGIDVDAILAEFGTDISVLINPVAKLDAGILGRYFEKLVESKKDSRIGLKSGFLIPFNLIAAFFNLYRNSKTVGDLFMEMENHTSTANTISCYSVRTDERFVYYEVLIDGDFSSKYPVAARQWMEMQYGMALQYAYGYTGRFIQPVEVHSVYGKEGRTDKLEEYLNCPIKFNQKKQTLIFRKSILELPVTTTNKEHFSLFENTMSHIGYYNQINSLSNVVRRYLMHSLSTSELSLKPVAARFNMSERNLQRKLKAEGTSYQKILDDLRMELAQKYLRQHIPLTEVTFLLGFETQSAFNKFFSKHFDMTPSQFK
ncbi:AraC family transcriptional regulator [Bacteroidales bacterium OttesenSCG-928-J19]|nr:AraC family transcriptional regulator [Bacteroidales bacterium OttesenSCG-928-J19]